MNKIAFLFLIAWSLAAVAEPPAKVLITAEKKRDQAAKGAVPRAGSQAKSSESIHYVLTFSNVSPGDLSGLSVDYVFFVERQKLGEVKSDGQKVERIAASQNIDALTRQAQQMVTSGEVTLNKENLVGTYHFKSGGRIRAEDAVIGVWVRVSQGGQIIGEYANPPTVTKRGWGGK